jgi:hypothetical protein
MTETLPRQEFHMSSQAAVCPIVENMTPNLDEAQLAAEHLIRASGLSVDSEGMRDTPGDTSVEP